MISPTVLRERFTAAIQGIVALTAVATVVEYIEEEDGDLFSTVNAARPTTIVVACQGFHPSGQQMKLMSVDFSVFFKHKGDPFELVNTLLNGYTAASGFDTGVTLQQLSIHPRYHPMEIPSLQRRSIAVDEATNFDFWELVTSFLSRGAE